MRLITKNIALIIGYALVAINLCGCSFVHSKASADTIGIASLASYSGLKARISVTDFDIKAAKATSQIGQDVREMFITTLLNSNRFSLVDRQQAQVQAVQGKESADLIITASVTEFEPQASGGRAGIGGGGGVGSGALGGLLGTTLNKAHMGLDISIIDASTSQSLSTTHVQGQASDVTGTIKGGSFGSGGLGSGLSAYANTPMEKAIRICVIEAVRYMSQTIPASYYKYTEKKG
jgi:curli biogenesis system outer membrane secretion channel CsgG